MNMLISICGIAFSVTMAFLLTNTPPSVYACDHNSTNTNHTNYSLGVNRSPSNSTSTDSKSLISGIAVAVGSPGILSGNVIKVPVHVPCN